MDRGALTELATRQAGVFSRAQALDLGVSRRQIQRRLESGQWERLLPRVFGIAGYPITWRRRLWAAHLHAGPESVLSHETGGRLHSFVQVAPGLVVLINPTLAGHSPAGVRWHRLVDLDPADVQSMPGLGQVLDDLGPGDGISHSELERLADRVIDRAGLPEPVREYPLPNERGRRGFVDRCWPDVRWIVEADGRRWHDRNAQASADASRSLEAQAVGFETSRLRWEHLANDADSTARMLRSVYEQRAALVSEN